MQALGYAARFHERDEGGHGIGVDDAKRAEVIALKSAFVRQALGIALSPWWKAYPHGKKRW